MFPEGEHYRTFEARELVLAEQAELVFPTFGIKWDGQPVHGCGRPLQASYVETPYCRVVGISDQIDIQVKTRRALDDQLEVAVQNLQEAVMEERTCRILFTRHGQATTRLNFPTRFLRNEPRALSLIPIHSAFTLNSNR